MATQLLVEFSDPGPALQGVAQPSGAEIFCRVAGSLVFPELASAGVPCNASLDMSTLRMLGRAGRPEMLQEVYVDMRRPPSSLVRMDSALCANFTFLFRDTPFDQTGARVVMVSTRSPISLTVVGLVTLIACVSMVLVHYLYDSRHRLVYDKLASSDAVSAGKDGGGSEAAAAGGTSAAASLPAASSA